MFGTNATRKNGRLARRARAERLPDGRRIDYSGLMPGDSKARYKVRGPQPVSQDVLKQGVLDRLKTLHASAGADMESFEMLGSPEAKAGGAHTSVYMDAHSALEAHTQKTSAPVAFGESFIQGAPNVIYSETGMRIRHSEFIGNLDTTAAPGDFTPQSFAINPGLPYLPWLSRIAKAFYTWRMGKAWSVRYVSRVGTGEEGSVLMARCPDPTSTLPITETSMMSLVGATEFQPWISDRSVHIGPLETPAGYKYVRQERKAGAPSLYDEGQVFVALQGLSTASKTIGKLFMVYDVELEFPNGQPDELDYGATVTVIGFSDTGPGTSTPFTHTPAMFPMSDTPFLPAGVNPLQVNLVDLGLGYHGVSLPTGRYRFDMMLTIRGTGGANSHFQAWIEDNANPGVALDQAEVSHVTTGWVSGYTLTNVVHVADSMVLVWYGASGASGASVVSADVALNKTCQPRLIITLLS